MAGLLGLRQITRLRYGSPSYSGLDPVRPSPTSEQIWASVDLAPRGEWAHDDGGQRTRRVVEVLTRSELRGADDGAQTYADRLEIDGRTYEVQGVDRLDPFEGDAEQHFEARAVEVQPLGDGVIAAAPPVNVTIPTIQGERGVGHTVLFTSGTWTGGQPITFTYSVLLDGEEVSTATEWTDTEETIDLILQVVVTATNSAGSDDAASQPLGTGGGPVDCEVTCADAISAAVAAAVAPLNATIASQAATIASQASTIASQEDTIDDQAQTIVDLNGEITTLEATVASQTATIASLTAQLAARVPAWRSIGRWAAANPGDVIEVDPTSIANGPITIDEPTGGVSIPIRGGISAFNPATGRSIIVPLRDVSGLDPTLASRVLGALRVYATSGIGSATAPRWWVALINEPDPASATVDGVGVFGTVASGTGHRAGFFRCVNGTWTALAASTDPGDAGPVEGMWSAGARWGDLYAIGRRVLDPGGLGPTGGASTQAVKLDITSGFTPLSFASGAWLCLGVGQVGTGGSDLTAVLRGTHALAMLDPGDLVGVP